MRSIVALLLLGVASTTRAQCNLNNDQEQLCINYCGLSVQCNNQCANKPQNQYVGCICQDVCLCAMEICQSCCLSAPPQFGQEFCRSNAGMNLAFCGDPLGAGRAPNDNCRVYNSLLFTATAAFPSSIESFLYNIPDPTGVVLPSLTCASSGGSTPEASATVTPSQTVAAMVSSSPSAGKASSSATAASSGPSAGSSAAPAQATGSSAAAATTAASATAKPNHGNIKSGSSNTLLGSLVGGGVLFALL